MWCFFSWCFYAWKKSYSSQAHYIPDTRTWMFQKSLAISFFFFWYMIKSIEHTERTTLCRVISEGLGSHFLPHLCVFVVLHLNGWPSVLLKVSKQLHSKSLSLFYLCYLLIVKNLASFSSFYPELSFTCMCVIYGYFIQENTLFSSSEVFIIMLRS